MQIINRLNGKRILIWGYGREGKSTENFIQNYCEPESVDIFEGSHEDIDESAYDCIIKSPGIPVLGLGDKYTSQTELFVEEFRNRIIGVTGTKGKSTTSSLIYHVLSECSDKNVVLVGNIGLPCFDRYSEITEDTIIVYEMSCHQLAHLNVSPDISVFLNLHEDHLDYYKTIDRYFAAKCNIFVNGREKSRAYIGSQVPLDRELLSEVRGKVVIIPEEAERSFELELCGKHNRFNAEVVLRLITECFGIDEAEIRKSMSHFKGLPHRLEYVGRYDGIDYYDDSISTICSSAINAVNAVDNCNTVLIGGMDRGIDYTELVMFIKERKDINFICMYASGAKVADMAGAVQNVYRCNDLAAAVETAGKVTKQGGACILSPAAASYDSFKNFEERGEVFKALVKGL